MEVVTSQMPGILTFYSEVVEAESVFALFELTRELGHVRQDYVH